MTAKERGMPAIEVPIYSWMMEFTALCESLSRLEGSGSNHEFSYKDFHRGGTTYRVTSTNQEISDENIDLRPSSSLTSIHQFRGDVYHVKSYVFYRTGEVKLREYDQDKNKPVHPFAPWEWEREKIVEEADLKNQVMMLLGLKRVYEKEKAQAEKSKRRWSLNFIRKRLFGPHFPDLD